MHFLHNFDPEKSARERRKLSRKSYFMKYNKVVYSWRKPVAGNFVAANPVRANLYNERGQLTSTGQDLCDCLDETCPGCHFPCPKCTSNKCGHDCRVNRKWMYERIEVEGNDFVIKNEYQK